MTNQCSTPIDWGDLLLCDHTAGSQLLVRGLVLRNAVLPSAELIDSGLALPAPLAFNLSGSGSSNTSLVLDDCTVVTSCANLAQFAVWVNASGRSSSVQLAQVQLCAYARACTCSPHAMNACASASHAVL